MHQTNALRLRTFPRLLPSTLMNRMERKRSPFAIPVFIAVAALLALLTQLVDLNNEASRVPLRAEDALEHMGKSG